MMCNAMYMRDRCETIDLSLNSLVGGEDQFSSVELEKKLLSLAITQAKGVRMDAKGGSFIR